MHTLTLFFCSSIQDVSAQEAVRTSSESSVIYQHLTIFKAFYAKDSDYYEVKAALGSMHNRYLKSNKNDTSMEVKCICGQMFDSEISALRHRTNKHSNCGKVTVLHAKARIAIGKEILVPADNFRCTRSRSLEVPLQIGYFSINSSCLKSLSTAGRYVDNEVINASIHIFNQCHFASEYHFDLRFMHKLIDSTVGYNYDAVSNWTGFTNIFTRDKVHFSAVFNKHHTHFEVDIANRCINTYDLLGVNQIDMAKFILRYLFDEFQTTAEKEETRPQRPVLLTAFNMSDWKLNNVFVDRLRFFHFKPADSGVYLLKVIQLLHQSPHDFASISEDEVVGYRAELSASVKNFAQNESSETRVVQN
jgi:hypothetical protein